MRIAVWTPLPPAPTGIADYNATLLPLLSRRVSVTAVVDDRIYPSVAPVPGIKVIRASEVAATTDSFDLHVYHMGNQLEWHGYMHEHAQAVPGVLVLHDLSLWDFYNRLCGVDSAAIAYEFRLNGLERVDGVPSLVVDADGHREPDRLAAPLTARLVNASLVTVTHSHWARQFLEQRHPGARIVHIPLLAQTNSTAGSGSRADPGRPVLAALGGLSAHKRLPVVIDAFAHAHAKHPHARLLIAGRSENVAMVEQLQQLVRARRLDDHVVVRADVSEAELDRYLATSTVVISLRWPTAGETSGVLVRALASGTPVITSDAPQMQEISDAYCWRVSTDAGEEMAQLRSLFVWVIEHASECAAIGQQARDDILLKAAPERVVDALCGLFTELAPARPESPYGHLRANVIADWEGTTGLAEAARRVALALIHGNVELARTTVEAYASRDPGRVPSVIRALPEGRRYDVDLWLLNVNETHIVAQEDLRPPGRDQYAVASWYWEMPLLPAALSGQLARFDEIWTATRFVRDAFRHHTDRPVLVMPPIVEPRPDVAVTRSTLGLPEAPYLFFFSFDINSTLSRKNPEGVIRAFCTAFSEHERASCVRLVIKVGHLDPGSTAGAYFLRIAAQVGVIIMERDLTRSEMDSLLGLCDTYVSLHRSEGFGLGMAESMYLGKPVIATAYSGNMDFTTRTNSLLVGAHIRQITANDCRHQPDSAALYQPGLLWAEPDVAQAARWMRLLYEHPEEGRRVGERAAATIRSHYSLETAVAAMTSRLHELRSAASGNASEGRKRPSDRDDARR